MEDAPHRTWTQYRLASNAIFLENSVKKKFDIFATEDSDENMSDEEYTPKDVNMQTQFANVEEYSDADF